MLKHTGYINLPEHTTASGFDHAAVHTGLGRLYVAHTANSTLDVLDTETDTYLHSIPGLTGVAGALVSETTGWVFTSNRGENSVGMFIPTSESTLEKIIEKRALQVAQEIVSRTSHSMKLEDQENREERLQRAIKDRTDQIKQEMPKYLWD